MFVVYGGEEELVVTDYTNVSFQTDKDNSKSQSGFVFKVNGGAVSWKSSNCGYSSIRGRRRPGREDFYDIKSNHQHFMINK